jgi:hypothetical protein
VGFDLGFVCDGIARCQLGQLLPGKLLLVGPWQLVF